MVYTAMIMACHVVITGNCANFVDNRGPYATREECAVRIHEMTQSVIEMQYQPIAFRCMPTKGELS